MAWTIARHADALQVVADEERRWPSHPRKLRHHLSRVPSQCSSRRPVCGCQHLRRPGGAHDARENRPHCRTVSALSGIGDRPPVPRNHGRRRVSGRSRIYAMTVSRGREFLSIPGPTNIPDAVLAAMHRPAIDIYAGDMLAVTHSLREDLPKIFRTTG